MINVFTALEIMFQKCPTGVQGMRELSFLIGVPAKPSGPLTDGQNGLGFYRGEARADLTA